MEAMMADPLPTDSLPGKVIRWTCTDGPMPGSFEHTFSDDGTVVWRILDGPMKGGSAKEKKYTAFRVSSDVYSISYLAASGHTLTVILNMKDKQMFGYASNDKEWIALRGTVDSVQ
jgi:phenolic acid decarboxylase